MFYAEEVYRSPDGPGAIGSGGDGSQVQGHEPKGSAVIRRAQILLKTDCDGPNWTDLRIAEAFGCRTKTVENVRQRLVERGFRVTLDGVRRERPPVEKLLDGDQEARVIATRLSPPPRGYAKWTLRLLAKKVVELKIVRRISHETVRRTLNKMG